MSSTIAILPSREGGPEALYDLIDFLRTHGAAESNLDQTIRTLECLIFIYQNEAFIRYAILNKTDSMIYRYPEDQSKRVLRAHNGLSFHIINYVDPELAIRDYATLIQSIETNAPLLMRNPNLAKRFIRKIKDSEVGCLEARLADALLFLAFPPELHRLNDLFHGFFEELQGQPSQHSLIPHLLHYFSSHIGQDILDGEGKLIPLSWKIVKTYLIEIMGIGDLEESIKNQVFLLATRVTPIFIEQNRDWFFYHYDSIEKATFQCNLLKFLLSETTPEILRARVVQDGRGISFRLSETQQLAFEALRYSPRYLKSIRWDEYCFYSAFLKSITHATGKEIEPRDELRWGPRKHYRVFGDGVYQGKDKPLRTPLPHESLLSRPQSTTLITQHNQVPLFKFSEGVGVAFVFGPNSSSWSRLIKSDTGTISRPYDHADRQAALDYFTLARNRGELFPTMESFQAALRGSTRYNEVMARLYYEIDSTCIAVTSDDFNSRCVAQFLARETLKALHSREYRRRQMHEAKGDENDSLRGYTVPILYYLPKEPKNFQAYLPEDQDEDQRQVNELISSEDSSKRNEYFAKGDFSFLLLAEDPRKVLALEWNGQKVILSILKKGLFHIADGLLQNAGEGNSFEYLSAYFEASHDVTFYPANDPILCYVKPEQAFLISILLKLGASVHVQNKWRETPLYAAAQDGHIEIVQALLATPDIEVNKSCSDGASPLYIAAQNGHTEIVQALLAAPGIEVNKSRSTGASPLYIAAYKGHTEIVQALLARPDIEVNKSCSTGESPLYIAAQQGHTEIVQALLARPDIEVNKSRSTGESPLYIAAQQGHTEIVQALLARPDIEVNKSRSTGESPLSIAVEKGHIEIVQALLARPGIEVNQSRSDGTSPLFIAAEKGHIEIVQALLAMPGIEVNKSRSTGASPLFIAAYKGHIEIVQALLARPDIKVNKSRSDGASPLYIAAEKGHTEIVQALLARPDIEVNKSRSTGASPLYIATQNGHIEVVQVLLATPGIEVNKSRSDGTSPLYIAAQQGHIEIVQALLERQESVHLDQAIKTAISAFLRGHRGPGIRDRFALSLLSAYIRMLNPTEDHYRTSVSFFSKTVNFGYSAGEKRAAAEALQRAISGQEGEDLTAHRKVLSNGRLKSIYHFAGL